MPHHLTPTFRRFLPWPAPTPILGPSRTLSVSHLQALCQAGPSSVFKALLDTTHFQSPPHPSDTQALVAPACKADLELLRKDLARGPGRC